MSRSTIVALAVGALLASAEAATAHNSQAGSWGPTSHDCLPTPYLRTGGCSFSGSEGPQEQLLPPLLPSNGRYLPHPPVEGRG